jgi:hypothetical protein
MGPALSSSSSSASASASAHTEGQPTVITGNQPFSPDPIPASTFAPTPGCTALCQLSDVPYKERLEERWRRRSEVGGGGLRKTTEEEEENGGEGE